jgi:hypothetical protein
MERPFNYLLTVATFSPDSYQLFERCASRLEHDPENAPGDPEQLMCVSIGYS